MALLRATLLTSAILVLGGCGFVPDPTGVRVGEGEPMVYAMLVAGSDRATVLIERLKLVDGVAVGVSSGFLTLPVKGASVTVTIDGEVTQLGEMPDDQQSCGGPSRSFDDGVLAGEGCYSALLESPVSPGERYSLAIRLDDGRLIEGSAVVPKAPEFEEIAAPEIVRLQTGPAYEEEEARILVRFTTPGNPPELRWRIGDVFQGAERVAGANCPFYDSFWRAPAPAEDQRYLAIRLNPCYVTTSTGSSSRLEADSVTVELVLSSYDENYWDYLRFAFQPETTAAHSASGITGAFGVFGAVASTSASVTLRLNGEGL